MTTSALFDSLVAMVYTETNRPDLVPETQQAVLEATLSCHLSDFYFKDVLEVQVAFDTTTAYIQTINTAELPRYRNMQYFRKTALGPTAFQPPFLPTPPFPGPEFPGWPFLFSYLYKELDEISPDDLIDIYNWEKTDVFYVAGNNLNIRSSTPLANGQLGYYAFPLLDITSPPPDPVYNSWIAQQFPYAIVYRAAGMIFKKIGQAAASSAYNDPNTGTAVEQLQLLKISNLLGKGK